jgi:periplasmic protein TonB
MLIHDPAAKTHDRIGFTISMAIAFHVAVLLGMGFALQLPKGSSAKRMDITLSNYATDKTVLDADYAAQTNQEASGSESKKRELRTTEIAPVNDSTIRKVEDNMAAPRQQAQTQNMLVVTTQSRSENQANKAQPKPEQSVEDFQGDQEILLRQMEIASLQAKLDKAEQLYARLPRVRRATSVATKAAVDAEYLYNWQTRIETLGNQHYPKEAKQQKLYGDVTVLVSINKDGSLKDVRILESSGHKILDSAALKIVRLSSPYQPFPKAISEDTDVLEIVRTWQFQKNRFARMESE